MERKAPPTELPFRTLLDAAADMIWIRSLPDGRILEVNKAMTQRLGYSASELVGRPIFDFYPPEELTAVRRFSEHTVERGSAWLVVRMLTRGGERLDVELRGSLLDFQGKSAMLVVARDIGTELAERRTALTLYEAFKRSNDVMFFCDRDGIILDVNEAFTRHYGYRREEIIGQTPRMLKSRHSGPELYKRMWSSILDPDKGYWRGEIINKSKDGREIPLILTITAVKDAAGQIVGYISNASDMTEQVALQARVAQAEALATLGEMAAVVAHEIRNPLGSIVMASKQLASDRLEAQDRAMVLQVLRSESQRLNEALNNFLAYARPRELRLQLADLNGLVVEVANMVRSNPDLVKQVALESRADPSVKPVRMDPDQIRQVLWNVLLNAVQAVDGKGRIEVSTGRQPGKVYFSVLDTGPGIPEAQQAAIFKPFHTTKQQGTGLGLPIADRIVKAHGGRIEVRSHVGRGTVFTVWLPSAED